MVSLYPANLELLRYEITESGKYVLRMRPLSAMKPGDIIYNVQDLTKKNSQYTNTTITSIDFGDADPKITKYSTLTFSLSVDIPQTVSTN